MKSSYRFTIIFLGLLLLFAGCNRKSHLIYMRNADQQLAKLPAPPVYRLKSGDILYTQLITNSPELSMAFNNPTGGQSTSQSFSETLLYLNGYSVSDSGYIKFPIIGSVYVENLTVNEAREKIQILVSSHFVDATINVKLANFKVVVVGEVRGPGVIRSPGEHLNIFEAIAHSGDISENGNRRKVVVHRNENGVVRSIPVDLTSKEILLSEAFYLYPNDIIVVEPTTNKVFRMNLPYITLAISTISTALVLIRFLL